MNLDYRVLWFEDQDGWYDEAKKTVGRLVEELGFNFPEPTRFKNSTGWDVNSSRDYDLILVDFKLDNDKGDSIIEKIRGEGDIFTEVIFYSSDGDAVVRQAISSKGIDGVFCSGRDAQLFERKVGKVIETTLKKVQDLNNMRGLIMAGTSDIDNIMHDIIVNVIEKNIGGLKDDLTAFIFKNVESKVNEKKEKFDRYNGKRIEKIIDDNIMFDSYQKIMTVQFIIDRIDHELTKPHKNEVFLKGYSEVKRTRDLLAHVIEEVNEGKKMLKSGNRELQFTDEFCVEIRVKIKEHGYNLGQILAGLTPPVS